MTLYAIIVGDEHEYDDDDDGGGGGGGGGDGDGVVADDSAESYDCYAEGSEGGHVLVCRTMCSGPACTCQAPTSAWLMVFQRGRVPARQAAWMLQASHVMGPAALACGGQLL